MKVPDYIATSLWFKEEIRDPYQIVGRLFFAASLPNYRKDIQQILLAAYSEKVWKSSSPSDCLFTLELIESGINAAYLINKEKKKSALKIVKSDLYNPNLYCGKHVDCEEWDFFPRTLSFREFVNPYKTIKRFFKTFSLEEWKGHLKEVGYYALALTGMNGTDDDYPSSLFLYEHLVKLIEALHLIDVREINQVDGLIKNRIKRFGL